MQNLVGMMETLSYCKCNKHETYVRALINKDVSFVV